MDEYCFLRNHVLKLEVISIISSLFQAKTVIRLLKCLDGTHPTCTGRLLLLLAKQFVGHAHPALARRAVQLCTRQAEYLLTLPPLQVTEQLTKDELRDVLHSLHQSHLDRKYVKITVQTVALKFCNAKETFLIFFSFICRHSGLVSILNKLGSQCFALSPLENDQARPLSPASIQQMKLDKEWYISQVKLRSVKQFIQ